VPVRTGERRRFGRRGRAATATDPSDDSVDVLGTAEHAWWASRSTLEHGIPGQPAPGDPDAPEDSQEWDTDWLFAAGTTTYEVPETPVDTTAPLMDLERACLTLGVPVGATWEEVVSAHRGLAKHHHPDRLGDASDEARRQASDRMAAINVAFDLLRSRVGPDATPSVDSILGT